MGLGVRVLSQQLHPSSSSLLFYTSISGNHHRRNLSSANSEEEESGELWISAGKSAYDVLGVSESSSFAEIKASFRKLAKETHPDLSHSSSSTHQFLQILAAYEILSDSKKRAHYDSYLFSRRKILQKHSRTGSVMYMYNSSLTIIKEGEGVEWVKWYRLVIDDILTERRVAVGSGYFYELESELYSAIRAAYYGPLIESMDFLPDCFEAEERSVYNTPEVLHLVSGHDLFGIVYLVDKFPELSDTHRDQVTSFNSMDHEICQYVRQTNMGLNSTSSEDPDVLKIQYEKGIPDVYKDLELHISGQLVATASRSPSKCNSNTLAVDYEDQIKVFLNLDEDKEYRSEAISTDIVSPSVGSKILLGTINGLGTEAEEGICSVYDQTGTKTHVIMKHRTLMECILSKIKVKTVYFPLGFQDFNKQVKHMRWYHVGDEVSACECRCSRARLPPSKFWLFEPRSSMHDIGGWYIETFGRDKKGMTVPSQRQWDSMVEHREKRLHPAMYLLALAYRTLDIEDAKRRKQTVRDLLRPKFSGVLRWCKKLL